VRVYLDGAIAAPPGLSTAPLASVGGTWTVGAQNCVCTGQGFIGSIDELAVYRKPLEAERILAHYRAGGGT